MTRLAPPAVVLAAAAALAACSPSIPDSGAGVGFGDYNSYMRTAAQRDAQLASGQRLAPPPGVISPESTARPATLSPAAAVAPSSAEAALAAETRAALAATAPGGSVPDAATATVGIGTEAPLQASPANPAPPVATNAQGISQENNFEAVGDLRSIESDAARIARNRAAYQVIQPTALPQRSGDSGPNLVQYALSTTNQRGQAIYTRRGFGLAEKAQRACAKYPSPDLAQTDFLSQGGPQRDRLGLDPDGDGFACGWNPAPFRQARGG